MHKKHCSQRYGVLSWHDSGSVTVTNNVQVYLMQSGMDGREEHENKLRKLEHKRLLKTVVVPTSDAEVRAFLRALEEPVTFFGEGKVRRMYQASCSI